MNWTDLIQDILPHVPGCPEPLIEDTLRRVARIFCRDSHVWEEQLPDIYPVNGVTRYQASAPDETEIVSLSQCQTKTTPISESNWPIINPFGLLTFDKSPNPAKGPLQIKAILKPTRDASGMPDRIGLHYSEALINGTIAKLQEMPKKDWTDLQLSIYHQDKFDNTVREARFRKANGNTDRDMRVAPRHLL